MMMDDTDTVPHESPSDLSMLDRRKDAHCTILSMMKSLVGR